MTRWLGRLAVLLVAAAPLGVVAAPLQAPHDQTFSDGGCDNCHGLYIRNVNGASDYSPGCVACHNSAPVVASTTFGFPWTEASQAAMGVGGDQHSWSGLATNPRAGANSPGVAIIAQKLVDGKLQCATCHDVHNSSPKYAPNSRHTSYKIGQAKMPTGGSGTGTMTLVSADTTTSRGFRVQVSQAAPDGSSGQFVISHDWQLSTPTWFKYEGGSWVVGTIAGPGKPFSAGTPVTLDDAAVQVQFATGVRVGDYWDFYVSYPFLRSSNVADAYCQMCHQERVMTHVRTSGRDGGYLPDGSKKFSHPVGEAPNANNGGYDRTAATMLDANGTIQATSTDPNKSNDLVLDGGLVRCTTCHAVHSADSNSLTTDAR